MKSSTTKRIPSESGLNVKTRGLTPFILCLVIVFTLVLGSANCAELKFLLKINKNIANYTIAGMIHADSPISVSTSRKEIKEKDKGKSGFTYEVTVTFSREPSEDELERLELSLLPPNFESDPIGEGTTYSTAKWANIKHQPWSVKLQQWQIQMPTKFMPKERLMCCISAGGGFSRCWTGRADGNGDFAISWEGVNDDSVVKIVNFEEYVKSIEENKAPPWRVWRFAPTNK